MKRSRITCRISCPQINAVTFLPAVKCAAAPFGRQLHKVVKCILADRQQELKIGERGEKKKTSATETYERRRWSEEEDEEEKGGQDYITAGLNVSASVAMLLFNHA